MPARGGNKRAKTIRNQQGPAGGLPINFDPNTSSYDLASSTGGVGVVASDLFEQLVHDFRDIFLEIITISIQSVETPLSNNANWIKTNGRLIPASSVTPGTAVLLSGLSTEAITGAVSSMSQSSSSSSTDPDILPLTRTCDHAGIVIAEVEKIIPEKNLARLAVRFVSANSFRDKSIVLNHIFYLTYSEDVSWVAIDEESLQSLNLVNKNFKFLTAQSLPMTQTLPAKRFRDNDEENTDSGESRVDLDGVQVTLGGKDRKKKVSVMQFLFRIMESDTFEFSFPLWEVQFDSFKSIYCAVVSGSSRAGWKSDPASALFEKLSDVASFPVLLNDNLHKKFLLADWPLMSLQYLSLTSFRWPQEPLFTPAQGADGYGRHRIAGLLTNLGIVFAGLFNPAFLNAIDPVCHILRDNLSPCAAAGTEFLYCRIHEIIAGLFAHLRSRPKFGNLVVRGVGGVKLLVESLTRGISDTTDPDLLYPHSSWYSRSTGKCAWDMQELPDLGGSTPPCSSSLSAAEIKQEPHLCLYHVAHLYEVVDAAGKIYSCTRGAGVCPNDHPPDLAHVSLARLEEGLRDSTVRPNIRGAVAKAAGIRL